MKQENVEKKIKPDVCIADFVLVYVEKKNMAQVKSKDPKRARKARAKFVKEHSFKDYPITLDKNGKFPTEKTKQRVLQSAWRVFNKKNNFENFSMYIKKINIKHKSQVSYDFNYEKD